MIPSLRYARPTVLRMTNFSTGAASKTRNRPIKLRANRPVIQKQRATNEGLNNQASEKKLDWRIMAAT